MRTRILILILFIITIQSTALRAQVCTDKVTSASQVALSINKSGWIGNAFGGCYTSNNFPSCEYPSRSGQEHLFIGGLWVGGMRFGSPFVSTGAYDATRYPTPGLAGFEFTPMQQDTILERSNARTSLFFHPQARSTQDYLTWFTDDNGNQVNNHTPQGINVKMETSNWSTSGAEGLIIIRYTITHTDSTAVPMDSMYVGLWLDAVVRNVNLNNPGSSAFFNQGGNGYLDSLYLAYEFDASGDPNPGYIGLGFLGAEAQGRCLHPDYTPNDIQVHYQTWFFRNVTDPLYFTPERDTDKYAKMSYGLNQRSDFDTRVIPEIKNPGNRSMMLSAGPFPAFSPGDSIKVAFALIAAPSVSNAWPASSDTLSHRDSLLQTFQTAKTLNDSSCVSAVSITPPFRDPVPKPAVRNPLGIQLEIQIPNHPAWNGTADWILTDIQGKTMAAARIRTRAGQTLQQALPELTSGLYILSLKNRFGERFTYKLFRP